MCENNTICIVGPTACHKSEIAIKLAQHFDCEIVSADSVSVYRGMDIGSAKPSPAEQQLVRHYCIDCVDYFDSEFSVSVFQSLARNAIEEIFSHGKTPLVVGGSGLYVDAIYSDFSFAYPSDKEIRKALELKYQDCRLQAHADLAQIDPSSAKRLNANDIKRVIRALEVYHCSGKTMSQYQEDFSLVQQKQVYPSIKIGLNMDRELLYARINKRVDLMFEQGLEQEARRLYDSGADRGLASMQAIGYAQLFRYFDGEYDLETAKELCKQDTRRFAKRQLTWFKRDKQTKWFFIDNYASVNDAINDIILHIENMEIRQ